MLDANEVRLSGLLVGYAKEELSLLQMEDISKLLAVDIKLGEELELILIELENSGELP